MCGWRGGLGFDRHADLAVARAPGGGEAAALGVVGEAFAAQGVAALVDFDGTTREVVVTFVPEVQLGDYVIVHAGVALQRLDEAAAAETLALFAEMGDGEPV